MFTLTGELTAPPVLVQAACSHDGTPTHLASNFDCRCCVHCCACLRPHLLETQESAFVCASVIRGDRVTQAAVLVTDD